MDIGSGTGYPSAALSNFAPHAFTIDGIKCASMEGFLQSLKFENPEMQRQVCTLVGKAANHRAVQEVNKKARAYALAFFLIQFRKRAYARKFNL